MSKPTVEYWRAKAELCRSLAVKQIIEGDEKAEAGTNLMRMVYALSMVDTFKEGGRDDN